MAALTSMSDLLNRLSGGNSGSPQLLHYEKSPVLAGNTSNQAHVVHRWISQWRYIGSPNAGAVPTTVAAPDSTTLGALPFTAPGGAREKWITHLAYSAMNDYMTPVMLYDRLLHIGGLSGTVTTAQTVGGTLTRNTGGVGNQIWYEIYTDIGVTPQTISASYTNEDGTSGRTTESVTIGGSAGSALGNNEGAAIRLPLQGDDKGVRSVQSVTLSASTGTAGNFGVTIAHPIMPSIQTAVGRGAVDLTESVYGPALIPANACLAVMGRTLSTTVRRMSLQLVTVEA